MAQEDGGGTPGSIGGGYNSGERGSDSPGYSAAKDSQEANVDLGLGPVTDYTGGVTVGGEVSSVDTTGITADVSSPGWTTAAQDSQRYNDDRANELARSLNITDEQAQKAVGATNNMFGMVSPNGLSYSEAKSLADQGLGTVEGANANNKTQTVDQVMASKNVNDNVMPAVAGMITAAVPGAGLAMTGMKTMASISQGKPVGEALKDTAVGLVKDYAVGKINSAVVGLWQTQ